MKRTLKRRRRGALATSCLAGKDEAALYEEYYREVLEQEEKLREFAKLCPETMRAELERLKDYGVQTPQRSLKG